MECRCLLSAGTFLDLISDNRGDRFNMTVVNNSTMGVEHTVEDVDRRLATAFGLYALTDASLYEAATASDVTALELEMAIEQAGLEEAVDLDTDGDVSETIDDLLDNS